VDDDNPDDLDWTPEQRAFFEGLVDRFDAMHERRQRHAAQVEQVLRDLRALSEATQPR
jgi:hypothetical protein